MTQEAAQSVNPNTTIPSYKGVVENGRIKLPPDVVLPEGAKVYVVVPEVVVDLPPPPPVVHIRSPRLADPSEAARFEMTVAQEDRDVS